MPIVILFILAWHNYSGGELENQIENSKTEILYWRYLYLNYKEMNFENLLFPIEDYIED